MSSVKRGIDFIRVGAVGIRIWKTPLRFPNSWAGGKIYPPRITFYGEKLFRALTIQELLPEAGAGLLGTNVIDSYARRVRFRPLALTLGRL